MVAFRTLSIRDVHARKRSFTAAKFIIVHAKFIVFDTQLLVSNTKSLCFYYKFMIFTLTVGVSVGLIALRVAVEQHLIVLHNQRHRLWLIQMLRYHL